MESRRIALLGPAYPYRGGLAAFTERLALQFKQEGHHVKVFTFTTQYPNFLFPGKSQYVENGEAPELDVERVLSSVNPLSWASAASRIAKMEPQMLLTAYWMPFMAPSLGTVHSRLAKECHRIGIMHNVVPHEKRTGDTALTRYFVKRCDAFLTMTDAVTQDLRQFDSSKPHVQTPHPIYDHFGKKVDRSFAMEKLELDPEYRYLLFFGLVRQYKGLDILLDALAKVKGRLGKVKLLVAGEFYSDKEAIMNQIRDLGLESQVVVHDHFIADEDVPLYFSASDLLALPYRSATQSGVTQVAYHFDLPMLVTNVGGLPEMVPHGKVGYTVEPNSEAVAEALADFFENDRLDDFRSGVAQEKDRFQWSRMTRLLLELEGQLL